MNAERGTERILRTEIAIAWALRIGVWVSATIISFGLVASWILPHPVGFAPDDLNFILTTGTPQAAAVPTTYSQFALGLGMLDPATLIALGILVLISLPMIRVALAAVLFVIERDWIYVAVSAFVLSVLLSGLILGKAL